MEAQNQTFPKISSLFLFFSLLVVLVGSTFKYEHIYAVQCLCFARKFMPSALACEELLYGFLLKSSSSRMSVPFISWCMSWSEREYSELIYPSKAKKKIRIHRTSYVIFCSTYYEKRLGLGRLKFRRTNGICVLSQNKDTRTCTIQYLRAIHPRYKPKVNWESLSKILLIPIKHVRAWIFRIELPFLALLLN